MEWQAGESDEDSYAFSLAPAEHWALVDCVAIVSREHKPTGSSQGHTLADTSPLQAARVPIPPPPGTVPRRHPRRAISPPWRKSSSWTAT